MKPSIWTILFRPFTINDVTTGKTDSYPRLQPLRCRNAPGDIRSAVRDLFDERGDRWRLTRDRTGEHRMEGEIETGVFAFVDDVTIRFENLDEGDSLHEIIVRSRSRVGKGDLGQNARNIRSILDGLEQRLNVVDD